MAVPVSGGDKTAVAIGTGSGTMAEEEDRIVIGVIAVVGIVASTTETPSGVHNDIF